MDIESAVWWLLLNIISSIALAFYSMQEMACVSFNKIRLEYYVRKGIKRASWLYYLLEKPSRLFGTTLIGVNCAMFVGSECARQSYEALGLNPALAPLTQVVFIIIFAELAPMFAARRYSEHVALSGAPLLYLSAKILSPVLWLINLITSILDFFTGVKKGDTHVVLNQEELQQLLESQDEEHSTDSGEEINTIARNIFNLRITDAKKVMRPLSSVPMLPSYATVNQFNQLIQKSSIGHIPIYHREMNQIIGVASPRDFLRIPDNRRLSDFCTPPWFIIHHTPILQILKEFKRIKKNVAIVLNDEGLAIGILSKKDLIEVVFGSPESDEESHRPAIIIDRTFPATLTVAEFNEQFDLVLDAEPDLTLADLMTEHLGHHPEDGESIFLDPFELTVKETSLTGIRTISVRTHLE